jgi:hypothetical protein
MCHYFLEQSVIELEATVSETCIIKIDVNTNPDERV